MKKVIKYGLLLLAIALVGYKSVYFKKLSEVSQTTTKKFDAAAFTKRLWEERLPARLDSAILIDDLVFGININPDSTFAKHSNAMGIGNYRYSLVKLVGLVDKVNEDDIGLIVPMAHQDGTATPMILATEYIYGNAIRDASGLLDIKDFSNTTDLNNISEELNKTVRLTVLPPFKKQAKQGDRVEVIGAVELNKQHISFENLEIIPVRLKILQ